MRDSSSLRASASYLQFHQYREPGEISIHGFFIRRWSASVAVQIDVIEVLSPLVIELRGDLRCEAFDFNPDWTIAVVHPVASQEANWFVVAVGDDVRTVFLLGNTVWEMGVAQFFLQHVFFSIEVRYGQAINHRRTTGFRQDQKFNGVPASVRGQACGGRLGWEVPAEGWRLGANQYRKLFFADSISSDFNFRSPTAATRSGVGYDQLECFL